MKSENGWSELYNLIDTLNNFPDSLLNLLNIDRTLWITTLNYSIVNFDSYIGYVRIITCTETIQNNLILFYGILICLLEVSD